MFDKGKVRDIAKPKYRMYCHFISTGCWLVALNQ